ncbi:hypothetical protein PHYBOEH_011867 [Phytophthora boehmeriae]|uniref:M96 mating-specific protein family n=1 Tax=Phytophthora boehmeriae TaxID=109152 RepID=A0A8T1VHH4_9STRA|nr:hypothetical protein PHYBOEH_011867 [Phytophthora boehmeriae]
MSTSFLPLDELEPTLTDVLAFIDTFDIDGGSSSPTSSNSSNSSTCSSSDDGQASPTVKQPTTQTRKTRKAAASRRCQQKKRAELLALRAQTAALETRLKELKQGAGFITHGDKTHGLKRLDKTQQQSIVQLWMHKAQMEKHLRLESEATNRELRAVVGRQSGMAEAVRTLLGNVTNVVNIEEALRTPSPTSAGFEGFVPNLNDAIYMDLSTRLGKLYMDASTMFVSSDLTEMKEIPTTLEIRRDAVTGTPFVEFRSAICADLELHEAKQMIWNVKACHFNKYRKYMTDLGTKKETELELRDQSRAMAVSTMSLSRTYEEDDRVLVTFTSFARL